jgi:hypothetical protein
MLIYQKASQALKRFSNQEQEKGRHLDEMKR